MKNNTQHQKKQSTHVCIWTHGSNKLQFLFQKHVPAVVAATAFWMESCWRSLGETCALGVLKLSFCLCLVFLAQISRTWKTEKTLDKKAPHFVISSSYSPLLLFSPKAHNFRHTTVPPPRWPSTGCLLEGCHDWQMSGSSWTSACSMCGCHPSSWKFTGNLSNNFPLPL